MITNRQSVYDVSLMAAMYDDYSTKLTAAWYIYVYTWLHIYCFVTHKPWARSPQKSELWSHGKACRHIAWSRNCIYTQHWWEYVYCIHVTDISKAFFGWSRDAVCRVQQSHGHWSHIDLTAWSNHLPPEITDSCKVVEYGIHIRVL